MKPVRRTVLLCVLLLGSAGHVSATDAPSLVPARAVRLIAEGEDFSIERGWAVVPYGSNYFASTFAISFLSRQACLGAPEQVPVEAPAVATLEVDIPVEGEYEALVRYEQPHNFSVEFSLEILQDGKRVYRREFGRLENPKYWAFSKGEPAPMKWWFWGGGDNIVWETGGGIALHRGKAVMRLLAGPQVEGNHPRAMAARRHVDVICLSNDKAGLEKHRKSFAGYLPYDGLLTQAGDLFVRVTNPKDGLGPCMPVIQAYGSGQRSPWWVHTRDWPATRLVRGGCVVEPTSYVHAGPHADRVNRALLAPELVSVAYTNVPESLYLQPGETSGWVEMGRVIDSLHISTWMPAAVYRTPGNTVDLELEFAIPDGQGGLKPIHSARVKGQGAYPTSPIAFEMPHNVRGDPVVRTHAEALRWLRDQVNSFPKHGQVPARLPVYGIMGFGGGLTATGEVGRLAAEIAVTLGDNTLTSRTSDSLRALGVPDRATDQYSGHVKPSVAGVKEALDKLESSGTLGKLALVSYGDEHYIPPEPVTDDELAAFLAGRGVKVDDPIRVTASPGDPLFYYSRLCAFEKGVKMWAEATRYLSERTQGRAVAGVNYGPASHNMVDEINFVRALKLKGVSTAWSEDYVWQMPEWSVQVTGYRVSGFRAGAKYHRTPILMYIMPHSPGNTPRDFRLSYYSAVAHGATAVHLYCANPSAVGTTENYINTRDVAMFRAVYDAVHETGVFEDYVMGGTVRSARVALLLSSVDDIRNPGELTRGGHANAGRKAIYYALRHAQVPVDFVSEDDVIDGLADGYQLLYVTQEYLHSRAVAALARWVEKGGTLVALCGGGFRDEFGRTNAAAGALFGVKEQAIWKDMRWDVFQFKQDLPPYVPVDSVTWTRGAATVRDVPVILWKQSLVPSDGTVVGAYADGKPAVVEKRHGKGSAVLFGFMPGLAYLKSGLPLRPMDRGSSDAAFCHFLPTGMDVGLRRALVDAFLPNGFVRSVECSEPLVETTCIDGRKPGRLAVPLLNFTGRPLDVLTVRIRGMPEGARVRSVCRGPLASRSEPGAIRLELPLDSADMLLVDY